MKNKNRNRLSRGKAQAYFQDAALVGLMGDGMQLGLSNDGPTGQDPHVDPAWIRTFDQQGRAVTRGLQFLLAPLFEDFQIFNLGQGDQIGASAPGTHDHLAECR